MVSCCFNFNSLMTYSVEYFFHMLIFHLYTFFDEVSVQVFCPFFKLGCSFSYCWVSKVLYILWIPVIYHICLLQFFSLNFGLSFDFLNSVIEQKFLILIKFNLSIFFPWNCAFGVISKNIVKPKITNIFSYSSSSCLIILCSTFRSMLHFELIFVKV